MNSEIAIPSSELLTSWWYVSRLLVAYILGMLTAMWFARPRRH